MPASPARCMMLHAERLCPGFVLFLVFGLMGTSQADVIYTGNGATAGVTVFGQVANQTGASPASILTTEPVTFTPYTVGLINQPQQTVTVSGSAMASATPGAGSLLQVGDSFSSPYQGLTVGASSAGTSVDAGASWGNVTTTVTPPAGGSMPGALRLEFQVNYPAADANLYNGGGMRSSYAYFTGTPIAILPAAGSALQNGEAPAQAQANGTVTAGFHVDVPLSTKGVSTSSFSVGVASWLQGMIGSPPYNQQDAIKLSLVGIDLANGTALPSNYTVTFNSVAGPMQLVPTPEPATLAGWGVLTAFGALAARRMRLRAA